MAGNNSRWLPFPLMAVLLLDVNFAADGLLGKVLNMAIFWKLIMLA